ncbi:MAG: hypothetical protein CM15mP126_4150 [Gammaproteobacteria bacterium]|nr:MAG: hypothetical protein CM15mP126_4150 [Gammaproteobacteria bacterium]
MDDHAYISVINNFHNEFGVFMDFVIMQGTQRIGELTFPILILTNA